MVAMVVAIAGSAAVATTPVARADDIIVKTE